MSQKQRSLADMAVPTVLLLVVFALLRAANQTPDGLSYALAVRTGVDMFHPHHLVYVPVARLIHLAAGIDPITATLVQNLFWMAVLGLAAWRLAALIFPGRLAPVIAAVGLLALRGVMIYTVRVETYVPAVACLAVTTALAAERPVRHVAVAVMLALAILYHQTNVLFVLPLLVLLGARPDRTLIPLAGTLAGSAALVIAPYLAAAAVQQPPRGFWDFALNYARAPIEAWGNFDYFSSQGLGLLTLSQMRMILPVREGAAIWGSLGMVAALVILAGWHAVQLKRGAGHRRLRWFGLVFLAVYLTFFLWWMPSDTDFFVATLLPLWLLTVILVDDLAGRFRSRSLAVGLVALAAAGNLYFTIGPMHQDPGPGRALALALDAAAPPGAAFVTGYAVQQEMLYFTPRTVVHETEGLERSVATGETAREPDAVLVLGMPCLQTLLVDEESSRPFLQWLLDFDAATNRAAKVELLDGGIGVQVGPGHQAVGSWPQLLAVLRDLGGS